MSGAYLTFDSNRQERFARLSGDYNPVHLDPLVARRTQVGAPIVHGMHTVLRVIEAVAGVSLPHATGLKVQFRKPIYVGEMATVEIAERKGDSLRASAVVDGVETTVISIRFGNLLQPESVRPDIASQWTLVSPVTPMNLSLDEQLACKGALPLERNSDSPHEMFPAAVGYLGEKRVSALMACSRLVGMVVPGLHSIFTGCVLSLGAEIESRQELLHFAVLASDARFRLVRIGIHGGGLTGVLESASRLPPARQPDMSTVARLVAESEFKNSTALIVGGSRGLGEITAKMIAAGGGRVTITYASGRSDAEAVANEICQSGGQCRIARYDVRKPAAQQVAALDPHKLTHVYYFATPSIFRRSMPPFDPRRFEEFNQFYITGFVELVQAASRRSSNALTVFYPSSEAVVARPADMTEYAMSKAAAEILCADLQERLANLTVISKRLPRVATDQTGSILAVGSADCIDVMLPIIREMHRSHESMSGVTQ